MAAAPEDEPGLQPLTADADFLPTFIARFPQLDRDYQCHLTDNGDPLPHVFFWDVTTAVMRAYNNGTDAHYGELDWRGLLQFLEEIYSTASPYVRGVIGTSFLFSLPWPAEPGYAIVAELGPVLAAALRQVRGR